MHLKLLFLITSHLLNVFFGRLLTIVLLRTFGCLWFLFLHLYNAHKLDFCSFPCIFLGYNTSHLGYHYLDLSFHRIYMAHHVRFNEHIFPLTTSKHNNSPTQSNTRTCLPQLFPTFPVSSSH